MIGSTRRSQAGPSRKPVETDVRVIAARFYIDGHCYRAGYRLLQVAQPVPDRGQTARRHAGRVDRDTHQ
jgi:hypothetical protein